MPVLFLFGEVIFAKSKKGLANNGIQIESGHFPGKRVGRHEPTDRNPVVRAGFAYCGCEPLPRRSKNTRN
jgi:hypothetical protein